MLGKLAAHVRHNVVAYVALTLALGLGTAWAAGVAKNSVKSKHIKDGQVKSADLADGGVTGADVSEGTLGEVPAANRAATATSAENAATVDGKDSGDFAPARAEDWHVVAPFRRNATETGRFREASGYCYDPDIYGPCMWRNNPYPFEGPTHNEAAFYRDPYGRVHLQGNVCKQVYGASCAGDQVDVPDYPDQPVPDDIFQLPPGYRPDGVVEVATVSNDRFAQVRIDPDGTVSAAPPFDYNDISLENISFRCAPAGQNGCP